MQPTGDGILAWAKANQRKIKTYRTQSIETNNPDLYPAFPLHILRFVKDGSGSTSDDAETDCGLHLFYVHGGGFAEPIVSEAHTPAICAMAKALGASTTYIPEYTLSPEQRYPSQPVQIIEGLRYILTNVQPERIVIAGDSAGANLAVAALAHMLKPCPYTSPLTVSQESSFAGALLICPYTTFHQRGQPVPKSMIENAKHDFLTREYDLKFQDMYQPKYGEVWAEPGSAPADFWRDLRAKKVAVIAGEWEILRDDILVFAEKLREGATSRDCEVQILLAERSIHDEMAVDMAVGIQSGDTLRKIRQWCSEVRQSSSVTSPTSRL